MQTASMGVGAEQIVGSAVTVPAESSVPAVSWAAVIAGAFAMAALSLILLALGAGLGFASVSPWSNSHPGTTFGIAAGIWLIIIQWLSAAFGGYLTGRLRTKWVAVPGNEIYFRDTAHGFLAWAVAAVITAAALASAASTLAGTVARVTGTVAASSTSGPAATHSAAPALDPTAYLVGELFRSDHPDVNGGSQAVRTEATPIVARGLSEGSMPDGDKTYLARLTAAGAGLSQSDAVRRVDRIDAQVKSAWTKARQLADEGRKAASSLAFFTAFSMLIGAFIAAVAATVAGHRRDEVLRLRGPQ